MTPMPNVPGQVAALANWRSQNPGLANSAAYGPRAAANIPNLTGINAAVRDATMANTNPTAAALLGTPRPAQMTMSPGMGSFADNHLAFNNQLGDAQNFAAQMALAQYLNGGQMMPQPGAQPAAQNDYLTRVRAAFGFPAAGNAQPAPAPMPAYTNVSDMMKALTNGGAAANAQGITPQAAAPGPQPGMSTAAPLPGAGSTPTSLPAGTSPQVDALARGGYARPIYNNPAARFF